jgi:hypothetical protein
MACATVGFVVPEEGFEPPCLAAAGFKPAASAIPPLRRRHEGYSTRCGSSLSPWACPGRPAAQALQEAVRARSVRGARARQHRESNGVPADGTSVSACSARCNSAPPVHGGSQSAAWHCGVSGQVFPAVADQSLAQVNVPGRGWGRSRAAPGATAKLAKRNGRARTALVWLESRSATVQTWSPIPA